MDASDLFQSALKLHRRAQLPQAERAYRLVLRDRPDWPPVLFQLGMLLAQTGRFAPAVELLSGAVQHDPTRALYHNHLGVALIQLGDVQRAADCFRRAIELQGDYFEAHNNLGNALRMQTRHAEAIAAYERALQLKSDYAEAYFNMGNSLNDQQRFQAAIAAYRQAIKCNPALAQAYNNLGNLLVEAGRHEKAITVFRELIRLSPRSPKAHNNLGAALQRLGRIDEAERHFRQAISLDGSYAAAHTNLALLLQNPRTRPSPAQKLLNVGVAHGKSGDLHAAVASIRSAIELDPNLAEAHFNLGVALGDLHELDDAISAYQRAIQLRANYPEAHHALALVHLQRGDFPKGWPGYEFRWCLPSSPKPYQHRCPRWQGESLEGKTILLYMEQGLGDTIQFARYVPIVARQAKAVYLICQPALERLFSQWPSVHLLANPAQRLPPYDLHCALTSLPLAFDTRLDSIPAHVPYLLPDPIATANWKQRLDPTKPLHVGLVWSGNPLHEKDRQRSIPLTCLQPLAALTDRIAFYSLQRDQAARQRDDVPDLHLVDLTADLHDFHDTAAALAALDLLITVDTAAAHLAGALARPVWTLLAFASDWRWLLDRDDTPWYPTMRLFRQRTAGDWQPPIANLLAELKSLRA